MNTTIRLRLSITTLIVLLISMGLAAVLTWLAVEQLFLATQRDNLLAQARLTASALEEITNWTYWVRSWLEASAFVSKGIRVPHSPLSHPGGPV